MQRNLIFQKTPSSLSAVETTLLSQKQLCQQQFLIAHQRKSIARIVERRCHRMIRERKNSSAQINAV
ncbi:hypothetical protein [Anaerofustis sp.]|uniref:hypothetical protein n=1 Tax=Anaerofustis sp. TaxID=1872517 RepID=UPI0025BC028A|nr:hypothetical protein [Anaerofustis sp.]